MVGGKSILKRALLTVAIICATAVAIGNQEPGVPKRQCRDYITRKPNGVLKAYYGWFTFDKETRQKVIRDLVNN